MEEEEIRKKPKLSVQEYFHTVHDMNDAYEDARESIGYRMDSKSMDSYIDFTNTYNMHANTNTNANIYPSNANIYCSIINANIK